MTISRDLPQAQYAVYLVTGKEYDGVIGGLLYVLSAGPYTERKEAIHTAEEMNRSEPEVYLSYVVSEYKGKSWSP